MRRVATEIRNSAVALLGWALLCAPASPQTETPTADSPPAQTTNSQPVNRPLPDIVTLLRDVEANQRNAETLEKDYIYHSVETEQELDSRGQVRRTTVTESEHFWVNGVPIRRIVKKDGKPLSPEQIARENDRIDKLTAKANEHREKLDDEGKESDPRGNEEVTVSRLIELGSFANARRVTLNGRDTIAVDFTGNPKAKTRNRSEEVIRDMIGTAWIDENDHVLAKVQGHFIHDFKVGGGFIMSVRQNTEFSMLQTKVNNEVWLPKLLEGRGAIHALLFFGLNGSGQIVNSNYRKFRTSSTILPGMTQVGPPEAPGAPDSP